MAKLTDGPAPAARKPMNPGEVFTFIRQDGVSVTIERTARPYPFDLRDAYNKAMLPEAKARGLEYFVDNQGDVRLGFPEEFSKGHTKALERKAERERADWKHRQANPIEERADA